jgi:hypothetical protein
MPRLRRSAAYTRHPRCAFRPRRPVSGSGLSLAVPSRHVVLSDPGEFTRASAPSTSTSDSGLRPPEKGSALPTSPQAVSRGAQAFEASWFASATTCRVARLPDGSTRVAPSHGDFYVRASDGSITLPAAGYDYGGGWAPPPAGLSPAGTAASLAAPQVPGQPLPPCHDLRPRWSQCAEVRGLAPPCALVSPSALRRASASTTLTISGLNPMAQRPTVYASRPPSRVSAQDSLPVGGLGLLRSGLSPAGCFPEFQVATPSSLASLGLAHPPRVSRPFVFSTPRLLLRRDPRLQDGSRNRVFGRTYGCLEG